MGLKYTSIDSQEPKKSNDVRFVALRCIVIELLACENSVEFPAESGYKGNDLTRYTYTLPEAFLKISNIHIIFIGLSVIYFEKLCFFSVSPKILQTIVSCQTRQAIKIIFS